MKLISEMSDYRVKAKQPKSINNVLIPEDFCCPLSLELMSDPVIVASGQTYERAFIKSWLDQGCTFCPKTGKSICNTDLIPNYTVKALIEKWGEMNNIKIPDQSMEIKSNQPFNPHIHSDHSATYSILPSSHHPAWITTPRSPDSMRAERYISKDALVSNGSFDESDVNGELASSDHLSSTSTNWILESTSISSSDSSEGYMEYILEKQHANLKGHSSGKSKKHHSPEGDKQIQVHRSTSNAFFSSKYIQGTKAHDLASQVSTDQTYSTDSLSEMTQESLVLPVPQKEPEYSLRMEELQSSSQTIWQHSSHRFSPRVSSPSLEIRSDFSDMEVQVHQLIEELQSDSIDVQRTATFKVLALTRQSMANRTIVAKNSGAITQLVNLLHSPDMQTQENAVTSLSNLSLSDEGKIAVGNANAIDSLIHVLKTGNPVSKQNSAATLFSLSTIQGNKIRIGRSGAIGPLVDLLVCGTAKGKRDASVTLFNLSLHSENMARIVEAGAVSHLIELIDPATGVVDKVVAILSNLATIPEGRTEITHKGGVPALVEVVELGSSKGKENAAAALLQLCSNSNKLCAMVLQEGVVPPLVALSHSGTPRAKEKAHALLILIRNCRQALGRP